VGFGGAVEPRPRLLVGLVHDPPATDRHGGVKGGREVGYFELQKKIIIIIM
jgi:hypothetical protein